jgi:hypothetical protein
MAVGVVRRLGSDKSWSLEIEIRSRSARPDHASAMWRTVIIALIVLSVVACEDSAVVPSSVDGVIVGRVLDYSTRRPVSSAAVTFTLVMEIPPQADVPSTTTADGCRDSTSHLIANDSREGGAG